MQELEHNSASRLSNYARLLPLEPHPPLLSPHPLELAHPVIFPVLLPSPQPPDLDWLADVSTCSEDVLGNDHADEVSKPLVFESHPLPFAKPEEPKGDFHAGLTPDDDGFRASLFLPRSEGVPRPKPPRLD